MPRKSPDELSAAAPAAEAPAVAAPAIEQPAVVIPDVQPATMKDFSQNPYKKWIFLAQAVDSWRIWPRAFMTVYIILVYQVINWFMTLQDPNMNQAGLISVVVGAGAAWFGLYLGSSPRK